MLAVTQFRRSYLPKSLYKASKFKQKIKFPFSCHLCEAKYLRTKFARKYLHLKQTDELSSGENYVIKTAHNFYYWNQSVEEDEICGTAGKFF
jgi:hypothetical protein